VRVPGSWVLVSAGCGAWVDGSVTVGRRQHAPPRERGRARRVLLGVCGSGSREVAAHKGATHARWAVRWWRAERRRTAPGHATHARLVEARKAEEPAWLPRPTRQLAPTRWAPTIAHWPQHDGPRPLPTGPNATGPDHCPRAAMRTVVRSARQQMRASAASSTPSPSRPCGAPSPYQAHGRPSWRCVHACVCVCV